MHAMCLELSKEYVVINDDDDDDASGGYGNGRVLDVGSGSGYLVACFAEMMMQQNVSSSSSSSKVVGIEHIQSLVDQSIENLKQDDKEEMVQSGLITITKGDGRLGYEAFAPYALIHVGAAAPEVPEALLSQLAAPGRLIIPVGKEDESQSLMVIDKNEKGELKYKDEMGVVYVPLTDEKHQLER
jgi:protein-L-isoaspartate(D-aspartate) O-methyltransferase